MNAATIIVIVVASAIAAVVVVGVVWVLMTKTAWFATGTPYKDPYAVVCPEQKRRLREVRQIGNMQAWARAKIWRKQQGMPIPDWYPEYDGDYTNTEPLSRVSVNSLSPNENVNSWFSRQDRALNREMANRPWDISGTYGERANEGAANIQSHEWNGEDYGIGPQQEESFGEHGIPMSTMVNKRWTQHGAPGQSMMEHQMTNNNNNEDNVYHGYTPQIANGPLRSSSIYSGDFLPRPATPMSVHLPSVPVIGDSQDEQARAHGKGRDRSASTKSQVHAMIEQWESTHGKHS